MIAIVQVEKHDNDPGGLRTYELRINHRVIAKFKHYRRNGLDVCLGEAAAAAERAGYVAWEFLGKTMQQELSHAD